MSENNDAHRYYDFRSHPELVGEVLEDFRPFADRPAIREFYDLVRNVNGLHSPFETNDSAFRAPRENTSQNVSSRLMVAAGRVMVLFRELPLNTSREYVEWLEEGFHFYSSQLTLDLQEGVLGTSVMKMHILELETNKGPADAFELALHFWSWGDTDDEVFSNLYTVINNVHATLRALANDVSERRYLRTAPEGI